MMTSMIEDDGIRWIPDSRITHMSFPPRRCRLPELCKYLEVAEPTVYRWMKLGMPSIQVVKNGKRYFDLDEIDAWLKSRSTSPVPGQVA